MKTNLKRHSLAKIFNASVKNYIKSFPELHDLILFSDKGVIYMQPKTAKATQHNQWPIESLVKQFKNYTQSSGVQGASATVESIDKNLFIKPVFISLDEETHGRKTLIQVFDHEMGHHIVSRPNNMSGNKSECAAEAFSALIRIKRYGKNSCDFNDMTNPAILPLIIGDKIHYTSAAAFAVEKLNEVLDIEKLSRKEIAWYAKEIAERHHITDKNLDKLHKAFEPARKVYIKKRKIDIKAIIKIANKHKNDEDISRACGLVLTRYKLDEKDLKPRIAKKINQALSYPTVKINHVEALDEKLGFSSINAMIEKKGIEDRRFKKENKMTLRPLKNGRFII